MVKIKLKKYIVDFSAASFKFVYILPTEISQHIIDTDTIHTKIKLVSIICCPIKKFYIPTELQYTLVKKKL